MNKLTKSLATAALLGSSLLSSAAMAADKIGVVNVPQIFQSLPQTQAVEGKIKDEFKDDLQEIQRMEKDIKYYMEKQQRDAATMSAKEKKDLAAKLVKLREDYTAKAKPLQANIQRRQNEERNKIIGLIKQSIDSIAAKEHFDFVLNANAVAYAKADAIDITSKVTDQVSKIK